MDYIKILRRQHENAVLIKDKYQSLAEENQLLQERVQVPTSDRSIRQRHLCSRLGIGKTVSLQWAHSPITTESKFTSCANESFAFD